MGYNLDKHAALIYTMVLVSAARGQIGNPEMEAMGQLVKTLPVFRDFDASRIASIGNQCADMLKNENGLDLALERIANALPSGLLETAYLLACDVAAADGSAGQEELRLLEMMQATFDIEPLVSAAIERAAQARHRVD